MAFDITAFEDSIISKLKKEHLIERFIQTEYKVSPNVQIITDAIESSSPLDVDDQGLFYINLDGEKVYPPELYTSIDDKGVWLSEKLPDITFDIDQGGNVRMANEAEALYCLICVANIIKSDGIFKKEIKDIASNYSFSTMSAVDASKNFRSLLQSWQDLQSVIINILISACKFNISNQKKRHRELFERWNFRFGGNRIARY